MRLYFQKRMILAKRKLLCYHVDLLFTWEQVINK